MAKPGALERGHVKAKLIRELAKGERSTTQLAADFDVVEGIDPVALQ